MFLHSRVKLQLLLFHVSHGCQVDVFWKPHKMNNLERIETLLPWFIRKLGLNETIDFFWELIPHCMSRIHVLLNSQASQSTIQPATKQRSPDNIWFFWSCRKTTKGEFLRNEAKGKSDACGNTVWTVKNGQVFESQEQKIKTNW